MQRYQFGTMPLYAKGVAPDGTVLLTKVDPNRRIKEIDGERCLTINDAAKHVGYHRQTIRNMMYDGVLRYHGGREHGNQVWIPIAALDEAFVDE